MSTPSRAQFHLFGFPVQIRAGFVFFAILVIFINGYEVGVWLALFLAILTLLHELGHAFAARAAGAESEIALDMFYGYASFRPTRELTWWERAGISLAGPAVQIVVGSAALLALGASPFHPPSSGHPVELALWFAGPIIGLYNLAPVLPFDGGHVVEAVLSTVLGKRAQRVTLYLSVAITLGVIVYVMLDERWAGFRFFTLIPLIAQIQMLTALRSGPGLPVRDGARATIEQVDDLHRSGRFVEAVHAGAATYTDEPDALLATLIGRSAAAAGDRATAINWLREAAGRDAGVLRLARQMPEYLGLADDPAMAALLATGRRT